MSESSISLPAAWLMNTDGVPQGTIVEGRYEARFARTREELDALLQLRFAVFNLELGEGLAESYATGRDRDEFDAVCHHLMVVERTTGAVVGTYRIQTGAMAAAGRGFYSATLFDLGSLPATMLADAVEVGRACVAREHRHTQVLFLLWKGLALYMATSHRRYLFGCCSLTSQDPVEGEAVMRYLEAHDHVHPELRVVPRQGFECYGEGFAGEPSFPVKIPKLFRIYLRHGAKVCGPPAIDRDFKTIDYLVVFDVDAMDERQFRTFFGQA